MPKGRSTPLRFACCSGGLGHSLRLAGASARSDGDLAGSDDDHDEGCGIVASKISNRRKSRATGGISAPSGQSGDTLCIKEEVTRSAPRTRKPRRSAVSEALCRTRTGDPFLTMAVPRRSRRPCAQPKFLHRPGEPYPQHPAPIRTFRILRYRVSTVRSCGERKVCPIAFVRLRHCWCCGARSSRPASTSGARVSSVERILRAARRLRDRHPGAGRPRRGRPARSLRRMRLPSPACSASRPPSSGRAPRVGLNSTTSVPAYRIGVWPGPT